ncbi:MAG: aspartate--tRNA ligase [Bacteroidetes bacterium]|nr:MAG: aspartate--tRNA ligase [Bacteroidota bacterium]
MSHSIPETIIDTHGQRTHTCGELRSAEIGAIVVLKGWVDTTRNLGGLLFIDLRDRFGLSQLVFEPRETPETYTIAETLKSEFVISVRGHVIKRRGEINRSLPTGEIEIVVDDIIVLNTSEPLPFTVSAHEKKQQNAGEDLRLKYRYLDLRRPALQGNIVLRHKLYQSTRRYFDGKDFIEVETPVLMKSTPEGARDYLVPSRVHAGQFYALPQSPQTYKQLLMISGLDRYFQIVKCFRDEDLRADRQPEFTQIDVEMSFPSEETIYELTEGLMASIWKDLKGVELSLPFPRITYKEALERYGADKPDRRFKMELVDLSKTFSGSGFPPFDNTLNTGGKVLGILVKGEGDRGRGAMDRLDKKIVRGKIGAGGLFYFQRPHDGSEAKSSIKSEVLGRSYATDACDAMGAEAGDLVLVLCGQQPKIYGQMGMLRIHMAKDLGLIPEGNTGPWEFLWVTEFPLVEWDEDADRFSAMHHPFTAPLAEDVEVMFNDPGKTRARAYDLVLNGTELGGGSIRIHQQHIQRQMFSLLGIDKEEADRRFGFLLNAFRFGTPPHGGIALGLDRIVMLLTGAKSLREVIAFPKTQSAQEPMVQSPDIVDEHQLEELHIQIRPSKDETSDS